MERRRIGRYVLGPPFASGGMATVHLARLHGPVGFARTCAAKRLLPELAGDPEVVAMLVDEARLAASIRHPNVATVLDVLAEGAELLIVLDYVHGLSLAELRRAGAWPPPLPIAVGVAEQMLRGLHAAHETRGEGGAPLGIVHRDVSPHNVVVGVDGLARVIDFGIAKARFRAQRTLAGQLKGKLAYMAPEQLARTDLDRRADVFAAGVVLWEMLTGDRLFDADDKPRARSQGGGLPRMREVRADVPEALDEVVARALATERDERWASAEEMAAALRSAVPPARSDEIAAWLLSAGAHELVDRDRAVAAIERLPDEPIDFVASLAGSPFARVSSSAREITASQPTESVLTATTRPQEQRRSRATVLAISAGVVAVAVLFAMRGSPPPASAPVMAASATPAPSPSSSPSLMEQPAPIAPSKSAPLPSATPSPVQVATKPVPKTVPAKKGDPCSPPWTVDSLGVRTYKPECL